MPAGKSNVAGEPTALLACLMLAPQRTCYTTHACCLCPETIELGELYHDAGHGKRAHWQCIERFNTKLSRFPRPANQQEE